MEDRNIGFVKFDINGETYQVSKSDKITPETKLVDFIRDNAGLKGTKYMCREGGCGACVVTALVPDPGSEKIVPKAVNSCLVPVLCCDGWSIETVEHLGNKYVGYHPIQDRMIKFNASQCGYCTPGMVMSMHSKGEYTKLTGPKFLNEICGEINLLSSKPEVKVQDVENMLDGNICRCTGYRPILDAFKSLAVDAPESIKKWCCDVEELPSCSMKCCDTSCASAAKNNAAEDITMELSGGQKWIKVHDLNSAFLALASFNTSSDSYRVVAGNTAHGVYRTNPVKNYLDISGIPKLKKYSVDSIGNNHFEINLGSCVTLSTTIEFLESIAEIRRDFPYAKQISKHLGRVANFPVRNIATLGGNLMLKHMHKEFPSDVFVLLESVGAKITIASSPISFKTYSIQEFLSSVNMHGKLIISLHLPQLNENYSFSSFKITPRHQNAHAYVNAGILFEVDPKRQFLVKTKPRIVFGGISPTFVHATRTEEFLFGKHLENEDTLNDAMKILDSEVVPNKQPGEATPFYRKSLTKSLLYKSVLRILSDSVSPNVKSGAEDIVHKESTGSHHFDESTDKMALYKSIPKLEITYQVSGEAEYINDIPALQRELFGAFVLTTVAKAELDTIDASEAMAIEGVCRFITSKDIPGSTDYMAFAVFTPFRDESVFVKDKVEYAGQAVGLILADSIEIASYAAKKVKVTYKNVQKPIVRIADALKKVEDDGTLDKNILATFSSKKSDKVPTHEINGVFENSAQYHNHMETQQCVCDPKEDTMDVYSSTQWMDHTQSMIAAALNKPTNYVNMKVKRLGGGFGGKICRAALVGIPCAVAAYLTNRPVRVILDMETNMRLVGKRPPYLSRYNVQFNDAGEIISLKTDIFNDTGFSENEAESSFGAEYFQSVYKAEGWEVRAGFLTTDTPANTFCRGPGTLNCVALIEYIMEHIAFELKKDPLEIRTVNFWKEGDFNLVSGKPIEGSNFIPKMLSEIKTTADYEDRKLAVRKFNQENRWKKRGIAVSPSSFVVEYLGAVYPVYIAIYHYDGSIAVTHGGIEMGQGINTKVAQTVSTILEAPLEKIKIYASESLTGNNGNYTGGSFTTELCCNAAIRACEILVDRMKPVKESLGDNASWEELVAATFAAKLDLSSSYMHGPNDNIKEYLTWATIITEVEVDILTGEYKVVRVDLLEDVGKSLNPLLDIGQIEGAYVMGQGLWTTEKIIHDEETGVLLTDRTWNYKPPETKDIPEDLRVALLHDSPNPFGVYAVGEPPISTSVAVLFAIKNAVNSARSDAGNLEWFRLDGPVTPEDVVVHSLTSDKDFTL